MSFIECLDKRVEAGAIDKDYARKVRAKFTKIQRGYMKNGNTVDASAMAAAKLMDIEAREIAKKKSNVTRQVKAVETSGQYLKDKYEESLKTYNSLTGVRKFIYGKPDFNKVVGDFLEQVNVNQKAYERTAYKMMSQFLVDMRAKMGGIVVDDDGVEQVWKAAMGEKVDDPYYADMAKGVREGLDWLHSMYEQKGGILGKIENWMPQIHDGGAVKAAGFEGWFADIGNKLDWDRIIDPESGMPFITNKEFEANGGKLDADTEQVMRDIWDDISTNGLAEIKKNADEGKTMIRGKGGYATRRLQSRFLHFKNADAMLAYNKKFGTGRGGLFDAVINHVTSITRDIGAMDMMGPNPDSTFGHLELLIKSVENKSNASISAWNKGMYKVATGKTLSKGTEGSAYKILSGTQGFMRSAQLGSAVLSALSDPSFIVIGAKANGLDAMKTIGRYINHADMGNLSDRQMIKNSGYISDIVGGQAAARFSEEAEFLATGSTWVQRFADKYKMAGDIAANTVMWASGLQTMTQHAKTCITLELHGTIAARQSIPWDKLPDDFRNSAITNRITEADWKVIQKAKAFTNEESGAAFIRPEDVALLDVDVAMKVEGWTEFMRQLVTNEPTLRTKAISTGAILGDAAPGDPARVVAGITMMYKSFPISVINNFLIPSIRRMGAKGKADMFMSVTVGTMLMGAVALQAKDLAKGRDPRDMTTGKFWKAAALQGGGLGLFGDFLFADHNRFGNNLILSILGGPVLGTADDLRRVFMGNYQRAMEEEEYQDRFFADLADFTQRNLPGASLWYTRTVLDRLLWDKIDEMVDPRYQEKKARLANRLMEDYGQTEWNSISDIDWKNAIGE